MVEINTYDNPSTCLDKLEKTGGCDIALLDICMPGISGLEVAKEIRSKYEKTEIVFLTTSAEFAVEAFSVGAMHYLVKPFTKKAFDEALSRVIVKIDSTRVKKFHINGEKGTINTIDAHDILYVESFRNGRGIYTTKGSYTETKRTLQQLLEELLKLCPGQFISPYRGYIVNLDGVKTISSEGIVLKNDDIVPIKSGDFRSIRDKYFEWSFGGAV